MDREKEKEFTTVKILLVEDDEDDYIIINNLLTNIHANTFDITWTPIFDEGLRFLERREHDICLLDYRLGAHNGIEILEETKIKGVRDIPIILLTGQGEYAVDIQAMKAGAADYLVKEELTPSLLERSIRYSLGRASAARALREAHDKLEEKVRLRTVELSDANIKLKRASEKIKLFAYSISHDLKSPASSLFALTRRFYDNYAEILDLDIKGRTYCEQILKAAEQILSLVEKINIYISEKEMPLTIEKINLSELLTEIREEFSDQILNRKINWLGPEKSFSIKADRLSIIRVFRNLAENALKYGGDSMSYIEIGVEETNNFYILSVSDDGSGLKRNKDENIFLPFERNEAARGIEGSGLGLAIVKEIVEKHRGKVWVGQRPGKGAIFYFSISKYL